VSVPSSTELTEKIASKARVGVDVVETVLKANAVSLVPVPPAQRALDVRRLSFSGVRSRTQWDGPFEATFEFSDGVTALITNENLRGKSSVLELITWALRGSPRGLRADVRLWFERIVLEYSVNGVPMAVVLTKEETGFVADILRAPDADLLSAALSGETSAESVSFIATRLSESEFKEHQDQLMMTLLSLEPITNFQKRQHVAGLFRRHLSAACWLRNSIRGRGIRGPPGSHPAALLQRALDEHTDPPLNSGQGYSTG
jgi:hypothetical protein